MWAASAPLQVPDLETPAPADEGDLAFQVQLFAKIIRQDEAALFIGGAVLGLGVELPEKGAEIARGNAGDIFGRGGDPLELCGGMTSRYCPLGSGTMRNSSPAPLRRQREGMVTRCFSSS